MKAIITGGGIGGLAAAVALRQASVEAVVFERAPELRGIGAGVALWANATKVLRSLGLYEPVREAGAEIGGEVRSWKGRKLFSFSTAELRSRFGEANLAIHRADLHSALLAALPEGVVRLDAELVGFEQNVGNVVARFAGGWEETGDLLVGADGLRSVVRARVLRDGPPRYAGFTAWRGVVEGADGILPEGGGLNVWGRGTELGVANIGRGRAYWYATKNTPEGEPEGAGRREEVLEILERRDRPGDAFRSAVEATEEASILRTDLYDREPVGRWGTGRVTLLGDAAHPMTPSLGQGACQAIEDAAVLADALRGAKSAAEALRSYERRRVGRTASIVLRSRRMGRVMQSENPLVCGLRDALGATVPAGTRLRMLDPVVGYEV
ncbi:MAG: FAD-dependent monooxygenase [Actinomycetota bacterium]|nr:FAD-dependent monooxygenase [Actinomycetota bacterium]